MLVLFGGWGRGQVLTWRMVEVPAWILFSRALARINRTISGRPREGGRWLALLTDCLYWPCHARDALYLSCTARSITRMLGQSNPSHVHLSPRGIACGSVTGRGQGTPTPPLAVWDSQTQVSLQYGTQCCQRISAWSSPPLHRAFFGSVHEHRAMCVHGLMPILGVSHPLQSRARGRED
jgi:hypothetical protein